MIKENIQSLFESLDYKELPEEAVKAYRKRGMKMLRIRLSNFWILALLIF